MPHRVLMVDDDVEHVRLLQVMLAAHGFQVESASATDAPARARDSRPDLVLLDVCMPRIDGIHVAAALRADPLTHDLPILFVTALDVPRAAEVAQRAGGRVLSKPFRLHELLRALDETLATARNL